MSEPYWVALGPKASPVDYVGNWAVGTAYVPGQVVRHNGADHLAVNPSTGQAPTGPGSGVLPVIGMGTALPTGPFDGQEFILVDSLTAPTFSWRFRYVAAKATNKWVFIGGAALTSYVAASGALGNGAYTDLSTPGPSLTVPVAGDYLIRMAMYSYHSQTCEGWSSFSINGAAPVDADGFHHNSAAGTEWNDLYERPRSFAAGTTLVCKYHTNWSVSWAYRQLGLLPVAVGG